MTRGWEEAGGGHALAEAGAEELTVVWLWSRCTPVG